MKDLLSLAIRLVCSQVRRTELYEVSSLNRVGVKIATASAIDRFPSRFEKGEDLVSRAVGETLCYGDLGIIILFSTGWVGARV